MDSLHTPSPKLSWQEWLALAQEQGLLLAIPKKKGASTQEQAQAFYFLHNELARYPTSDTIQAIIGAYDGQEDDYYAQMLWAKRAHLLELLPTLSPESIAQAPALHQMQITQAQKDPHFAIEELWIVVQDLLAWQAKEEAHKEHLTAITTLSQNAPLPPEVHPASHSLDMQKSLERWSKESQETQGDPQHD